MATGYDGTTVWAVVAVAGVLTFAIRGSFVYLFGRMDAVPPNLRVALRYVPPAVFAALVFPAVVAPAGHVALSPANDRLVAGVAAAVAAWYTERVVVTIAVGMGVLWVLQFVV